MGQVAMLRWSLPVGAVVSMLGLLLRMWATGWLQKNKSLTTTGPYAWTRNPLYLGTLLLTFGHSLMSGLPVAPILFPGLCLVLYLKTIRQEETFLAERFGEEYEAYRQRTPRLLPRLLHRSRVIEQSHSPTPANHAEGHFHWPKVRRCYKGFVINAAVVAVYLVIGASHYH
jgi:steroid 5-alpha reductase family enzyme